MRGGLGGAGVAPRRGSSAPASSMPAWVARRARPNALLVLIAALIFTYAWRVHDLLPALAMLRPTLVFGLALLAVAVTAPPDRIAQRLRSPILGLLVVLLLVAAAGIPFAVDRAVSSRYLVTWVIPGALLGALIAVAVRGVEDVEWVALATIAAAVSYLAVGYARGALGPGPLASRLVFYDRNEIALMLVGLLPVALLLTRPGERTQWRLFGLACFVLFVHTIVRGGSRGGLVGLTVVLGYALLTFRIIPRRTRGWVAVATVVLLAAGGPAYWARVRAMLQPETDYNWSGRSYGRGELWRRGFGYIRDHPLTGVGVSGFPAAERDLSLEARRRLMVGRPITVLNAHNAFIQVAAELGLPGLVVFVGLLGAMARALLRLRREHARDLHLATVAHILLASLIGYVVCGFFLSAAYFPFLFILIGLVVGLTRVAAAGTAAASRNGRVRAPAQPAAPGTTLPRYEVPAPARW